MQSRVSIACWLALAGLVACSSPASGPARVSAPTAGAVAEAGAAGAGVLTAQANCTADNPFCTNPPPTGPTMPGSSVPLVSSCGSAPIDLRPAGVNIMLAVDGSASMASHWADIGTAIRSLRASNPTAAFGLHLFWSDPVDPTTDDVNQSMNSTNNGCKLLHNQVLELGDHSAQELVNFIGPSPQGGVIMDVYQVSALIDSLNTYLTSPNKLEDPKRTNYLVVFTNANDNCFGSAYTGPQDKLAAYKKLSIELSRRNVRLIPVGMDAPGAAGASDDPFAIFGPGLVGTDLMNLKTNYDALGVMLANGGSALKEVPRIDSSAKLQELVSVVGSAVSNCRFALPEQLDSSASPTPFAISFMVNSQLVPRDRHEQNGWDFVKGSTGEVEFFGQACQALQSGKTVTASKSCEQNICGTAAVSASTKPRTVLLLLDSSASRIECVDGSLNCLSIPTDPSHTLTYWEVVEHAVSSVLLAPVNDEVAFGMQFFPSKNAEQLTCDVAMKPEIAPAPGMQIAIMKAMLEKIPLGLSPDVGVMEAVAAQPGQLVDPGVVGAVVLLSDGGDNCSGDAQAQIVARLGGAAKKLFDRGVKTFAIRYGSADGETPEQAQQLASIAQNGGTASAGQQVAYIDAKTPDELGAALAGISDQLATCSFALGAVPATVDKSRTNLFLDGEQVGFDAMATQQEGWSWMDAAQTSIVLHGDACTAFKTNRHTNIVVEFGCMPVVIKGPD
jgi:hypothetical protein